MILQLDEVRRVRGMIELAFLWQLYTEAIDTFLINGFPEEFSRELASVHEFLDWPKRIYRN